MKCSVLKRVLAMAMCVLMLCSTLTVGASASEAAPLMGLEIVLPPAEENAPVEEVPSADDAEVPEEAPEEVPEEVPEADGSGTSSDTGSESGLVIGECFPDAALQKCISASFDSDGDGVLSEEEVSEATVLKANFYGITDATGLTLLTELTSINLNNNDITSLDVSGLSSLEELSCCGCLSLESLDVTGCESLATLLCYSTALSSLDLSDCASLTLLAVFEAGMKAVDISGCTAMLSLLENSSVTTMDMTGVNGDAVPTVLYTDANSGMEILWLDEATVVIGFGEEEEEEEPLPAGSVPINELAFPDELFRTYIHMNLDGDGNAWLTPEELELVYTIDFTEVTDYTELESLEGIEYFYNLSTLICNNVGLDSLDLSSNTNLSYLECQNNGLTELNLTGLSNLLYLDCEGNRLTELDISGSPELKVVKCSSNHDLTVLDVTNIPHVKRAVEYGLEQTYDGFRSFHLDDDDNGECILWIDSDVGIIGAVAAASGVYIDDNSFPDFYFQDKVRNLYDTNPSNGWLSAKEIAEVTAMELSGHIADTTGIEYFTALTSFSSYEAQYATLDLTANTALQYIDINRCPNLTELNVAGLTALESFCLTDNSGITELDFSGCTALKEADINRYTVLDGPLETLNLDGCSALEYLLCWDQALTALDLSDCPLLEEVTVSGNDLTSIDLTGCTALVELDVGNNDLTALDVSDCTAIKWLDCDNNQLTTLDVTGLASLASLGMCYNPISGKLDVSDCTALTSLDAAWTDITGLDVTGCEALEYLRLQDTGITSLDLSKCPAMRYLTVYGTTLNTLDISGNPKLIAAVEAGVSGSGCSAFETIGWIEYETTEDYTTYYLQVDETLKITGADVPEGYLITAYHFPDEDFRDAVADALGVDEDDFVPVEDFLACTSLGENTSLERATDLTGLELFPNLTSLRLYGAQVTEVDLSLVPNLTSLDVTDSAITKLDLSPVPNLTSLDCTLTAITELDLTGNMTLWNSLAGITPSESGYELEDGSVVEVFEYYNNDGDLILSCNQDTVIIPKLEDPELVDMFPDATFRAYMREQFDADEDGMLSDAELAAVTEIDCSGLGIESMEGLWYLIHLERLDCSDNDLTELNVENCGKMTVLDCSDNGISSLYLRNQAFKELYLSGNPLASMQLSSAATLRVLDIHDTDMTNVSLYGYAALEELDVSGTGITYLELGSSGGLRQLNCSDTAVEYLSVPGGGALSWLVYNVEPTTENGVTTYRTTDADGDIWLIYDEDVYLESGEGDDSGDEGDDEVVGGDYDTTEDLSGINQNVDVPLTAEYFPDANFLECVSQFDENGDEKLSYAERAEIYGISCVYENIGSVRGIEYFPELIEFACIGNQVTYLNLTANTKLAFLSCEDNRLTGMNLAGLTDLRAIYASGNFDLTALDISDSAMLMDLVLAGCGIEELDVTGCPELQMIDVSYTSLAELDTSENPNLTHIWISGTGISQLDLEGKTELTGLYISETNIPMPDIRQFPNLKYLYCGGMGITELPLEYVPNLASLSCPNNELTELNLSAVPELAMLDCSNNRLTELDVSALPDLSELYCYGNNIAELDIRNNPSLCMIYHDGEAYVGEDIQEYSLIAGGAMWILSADGSTVITATNAPATDGVALSVENFPDPAFLEYVAAYYDGNGDGVLSAGECYFVQAMDLEGEVFTDLTGIEHFTELQYLYCYETGVTELDLSANNKLVEVELRNNPLETLTVGRQDSLLSLCVDGAELTELNVSGCPALMVLGVVDTPVEKVDISNCPVIAEIVNNAEPLEYDGYLLWVSPDGDRGMTVDAGVEIIASRDDLTDDSVMDEEDVEVILNYIALVDTVLADSPELQEVADVNTDGTVDARDATQILRYANGLDSVME